MKNRNTIRALLSVLIAVMAVIGNVGAWIHYETITRPLKRDSPTVVVVVSRAVLRDFIDGQLVMMSDPVKYRQELFETRCASTRKSLVEYDFKRVDSGALEPYRVERSVDRVSSLTVMGKGSWYRVGAITFVIGAPSRQASRAVETFHIERTKIGELCLWASSIGFVEL